MRRSVRYILALCVSLCAFFLALCLLPEDVLSEAKDIPLEALAPHALRDRYGHARALSRRETRALYNNILNDLQRDMDRINSTYCELDRAYACTRMRSVARRYARSRDRSLPLHITDWALQVRDAYVHGGRYLWQAVRHDLYTSLRHLRPTMHHTRIVLCGMRNCLLPSRGGECPSYRFLREIRGKNDTSILATCTRSNPFYNQMTNATL